ncbi:MAG: sensor histidine kinase [Blastococcus sp.]
MRRFPPAPGARTDVVLAVLGVALTAVVAWLPVPLGTPIAGPAWFLVVFPVVFAAPLAWRRSAPLAAFSVTMAALVTQAVLTGDSPEGLELILVVGVGAYSVAAYGGRSAATAGLGVALAGYAGYALENRDIRTGRAGELWAGAFFGVALIALWLLGVFVRSRRESRRAAEHAAALDREARQATTHERARLARELHDVISHTLSVVVVQAAGARASGNVSPATLEKIEHSGRESMAEMRRLLDVLRRDDDEAGLAPQPGVTGLPVLAGQLRDAGLPVELTIEGDCADLPATLGLSVYRIVQEALTNTLSHAGPARARVTVRAEPRAVTVEVVDDGTGPPSPAGIGHGLIGMRERVTLFGGELSAGPRPEGGFAVMARLPRESPPP